MSTVFRLPNPNQRLYRIAIEINARKWMVSNTESILVLCYLSAVPSTPVLFHIFFLYTYACMGGFNKADDSYLNAGEWRKKHKLSQCDVRYEYVATTKP